MPTDSVVDLIALWLPSCLRWPPFQGKWYRLQPVAHSMVVVRVCWHWILRLASVRLAPKDKLMNTNHIPRLLQIESHSNLRFLGSFVKKSPSLCSFSCLWGHSKIAWLHHFFRCCHNFSRSFACIQENDEQNKHLLPRCVSVSFRNLHSCWFLRELFFFNVCNHLKHSMQLLRRNGEVSAYFVHHFPVCTRNFLKNCGSIGKNDAATRFLNALTEDRRRIIGCMIILKKMKCRTLSTCFWSNMRMRQWSYRTLL